ncbi:MAG: aldehyde dehydrogenase family protein [Armatimonadota bacterium]|nr:aldehyde dehydrogenase family protein [Armatimonadota bacterium]MDR7449886.1 aldehyde dehydrogenase family protein [Armatimonadota bacterium]MDR7459204.1 aldehyde dehydrogenase family protein [Armatimonadota bacterium]MDR7479694.1 aldehyde dehydrogenase family protein [Armatimonadota bacterium]MDR7487831.1 aldehyde dehydrogenase family protein [Armatimonadota bacterium]
MERTQAPVEYRLFIGGRWVDGGAPDEVRNKYTGEVLGTLPVARREDVEAAVEAAQRAAPVMAEMPVHRRAAILRRAAELIAADREGFARTIAAEAGKALKYARIEVDRGITTFTIAAEEARRLHGETVPLDAVPAGEGYFGFWVRRPVGVIAAITPFNFPLNLVAHKVAPALAAGNTVVLKPAGATPLTAVRLCRVLEEAGLPAGALNLVHGPGGTVGEWLVTDPRVAKVTFTGSPAVGERITRLAGLKKVTLELGNTSPVIIAPDADLEYVARRCAVGAYYNSGQVCISVQRIYTERRVYEPFLDRFVQASEAMVVGDPLDERVDVGPMIDRREAERIEAWITEALQGGARVVTGGRREGAVVWPTVLTDVRPEMKVVAQEAFAPVASVIAADDFEEALRQADATEYGLQAAVFTRDLGRVFQAIRRLNFGGVVVNDTPAFRADHMPYGGNRRSGIGREGVRYAMEEMTNIQMVAIRLEP